MPGLGHHITIRLCEDRVLTPTMAERRIAARVILEQGRSANLINFSIPDTHAHMNCAVDRTASNQLARRMELSLGKCLRLPIGFERARVKPVRDIWHQWNTFVYLFDQYRKHGLTWDPYFEGTNLPDLLGLRLTGAYTKENLRRYLPRMPREQLLTWLGCTSISPAEGPPELLLDAAAAAAALPTMTGQTQEVQAARRSIVEIAGPRMRQRPLAELLGISRTSLYRLKQWPVDHRLVQAVRLQLGLRAAKMGA
ncbi:MAG: hypothetical protein ABI333_07550 [bacterium]